MSTSSESSVLQSLLKDAIDKYKIQVGTGLIENQVATQLGTCDDVESVSVVLEERVHAFRDVLDRDRHHKVEQSIRRTVYVLHTIFTGLGGAVQVGHSIDSIPFPPVKLIFTAISILLATVKDVRASYDALLYLFESIGNFVQRLDIYTKIPPTTVMTEIVVKIIVELLFTLGLATKQIKQGPLKKFGMKLLGENEVEAALQRLDRLTDDEARATAVQTLEVVYRLVQNMGLVMDDSKASNDGVRQVLEMMQEMTSQANKEKRDQMQQDLRRWLSPSDPWKNHNIACDAHHNGTTTWFIESDPFAEWQSSGSLLWIRGKPGAGRTTLCSTIIKNIEGLRKSGLASLALFYCDFGDDEKKDLRSLLSSLLFQLCDQSDSYCNILSGFYSGHRNGSQDPSDRTCTQCLEDVLKCPGQAPIYIIIDALDECLRASGGQSSRKNVLRLVEELVGLHFTNLRICITSRPEADIESVLKDLTPRSVSLHDERGQDQDIIDYVVNTNLKMKRREDADKELVIETPSQNANGTYERILEDIDEANWKSAHRIFQCITVASRPLTVKELANILAFDFEAGKFSRPVMDRRLEDPYKALLSTCRSLIAVNGGYNHGVVEFSRFLVKEFLTSSRLATGRTTISRYHVLITTAHAVVAQACVGALLHLDENVSEDTLKDFPLVKYAAGHWADHAQIENVSLDMQDDINLLFDPSKPHFSVWIWIFDPAHPRRLKRSKRPSTPKETPLHYAALYGLCGVAVFLVVERSQDVNSRSSSERQTPVSIASKCGNLEITRTLLQLGADANAQDQNNQTPLHLASQEGYLDVAEILLDYDADASARDKNNQTALHLASQEGYQDVAQLLLDRGVDAYARENNNWTPLHLASHPGVAELFLNRGVDPNVHGENNQTPLHLASQMGYLNVVQVLLDRGADVNSRANDNRTPLHLASQGGHLGVAELLLNHGAGADAREDDNQTPLHLASQGGHLGVAELLLNHGADPNARDKNNETPLYLPSQKGYLDVVKVLLDRGADANAREIDKQTPLHLASQEEHLGVAELLLNHGADPNARGKNDQTPLHLPSQKGYLDVVQVLLDRGADANARANDNRTPLHFASQGARLEIAQVLLKYGADANGHDKNDKTPLHLASLNGDLKIAQLLLDRGADANSRDDDNMTPLHCASQGGDLEVVRLLLNCGADVGAHDTNGQTPLQLAFQNERPMTRFVLGPKREYLKIAEVLLERGADANVHDKSGKSPLHLASQNGDLKATQLLLDRGADANSRDKDNTTPLHCALQEGHPAIARLLLNHGADANARGNNGQTPLHLASINEHSKTPLFWGSQRTHLAVVKCLLERGADANAHDKSEQTPLHLASHGGYFDIAQALLDRDADPNARENNNRTPLHLASQEGCFEVCQLLLLCGADANSLDNDDMTPLHMASKNGHLEVVQVLLCCGADVNAREKGNNQTPFHWASTAGHLEVVSILLEHGADARTEDDRNQPLLHLASQEGHSELI